jgi:hypothetical protein
MPADPPGARAETPARRSPTLLNGIELAFVRQEHLRGPSHREHVFDGRAGVGSAGPERTSIYTAFPFLR